MSKKCYDEDTTHSSIDIESELDEEDCLVSSDCEDPSRQITTITSHITDIIFVDFYAESINKRVEYCTSSDTECTKTKPVKAARIGKPIQKDAKFELVQDGPGSDDILKSEIEFYDPGDESAKNDSVPTVFFDVDL